LSLSNTVDSNHSPTSSDGFGGNVTLYLGPEPAFDAVIFYYSGYLADPFLFYSANFSTSEDATIPVFPTVAPTSPTSTPSGAPSAPTVSPAPSGSEVQVLVQIVLDLYASETGYRILSSSTDEVLHEVEPGSFVSSNAMVSEVVLLPREQDFTFLILDEYG
jgi:hypothetical protein